ncbi:hypothetical protein NEIELOOT_00957 [Neisseria elongata subsp. glycolytica ATCC 29315]|uniref:Uncharacterized protein n=1 Tax=Neisseria elongata subsp. glycolytica ATCC 29315 TaxID=546263 RepID=D4DPH0_NEIEG|nr:hypothetical protein NEIELOOT_00957 [Neisseria elongata subsp. glycolytica ATCC 29315]
MTRIGKRPSEKHQPQSGKVFQTALLVQRRWLDANLLWLELQAGQGEENQDCSNREGVNGGGNL